jgi:hypothetical protein
MSHQVQLSPAASNSPIVALPSSAGHVDPRRRAAGPRKRISSSARTASASTSPRCASTPRSPATLCWPWPPGHVRRHRRPAASPHQHPATPGQARPAMAGVSAGAQPRPAGGTREPAPAAGHPPRSIIAAILAAIWDHVHTMTASDWSDPNALAIALPG